MYYNVMSDVMTWFLILTVKQTREAVLDSNFFVLASSLGAQQAHQLQTHFVSFERDVFAEKLVSTYENTA